LVEDNRSPDVPVEAAEQSGPWRTHRGDSASEAAIRRWIEKMEVKKVADRQILPPRDAATLPV
jgi:hypothetical protein